MAALLFRSAAPLLARWSLFILFLLFLAGSRWELRLLARFCLGEGDGHQDLLPRGCWGGIRRQHHHRESGARKKQVGNLHNSQFTLWDSR